ncbi:MULTISPECIES: amidase [Streptomyces]|uniref:Amidase n=1 Tax=Streptomyces chilikensis TaxID=1194079 RepID=A0ABV3EL00_9ACTN|nr:MULTISPECIES: amidase [Streptomyces]MDH6223457.1 amidase [Streptomyces sp. MJP52]
MTAADASLDPVPDGPPAPVLAFRDDALGTDDAVALLARLKAGEVSAAEVARAAVERIRAVDGRLNAMRVEAFEAGTAPVPGDGPLAGVPTLVKDNTTYAGLPTGHGTAAFTPRPASRHAPFTRQFTATGMTVLGKTRLPEFGFNASTEFEDAEPVRNPWNTEFSAGGSSGGSAALVAAGAVPIAHANDGGGSIRIPAACCGLVGLKPTRGRMAANETGRSLPIDVVVDGAVTRTVRDTAAFLAAAEQVRPAPELPPIGRVEGPGGRRLRVGLLLDSPTGTVTDDVTRAAVTAAATTLEGLGHRVEPYRMPLDARFEEDFVTYWGMLAFLAGATGRLLMDRRFDRRRMDGLSQGLRGQYLRQWRSTPGVLRRLRRAAREGYEDAARYDVVLSPVLAHTTPRLGHLSPAVPFPELIARLKSYVAFTPVNNVCGSPAISLPGPGRTPDGLPVGVMLSGRIGEERTLLEAAYELEAAGS